MNLDLSENLSDEFYNPDYSIKRKIIPEGWKAEIDDILKHDLLSANRYFASTNPKLVELIDEESKLDPVAFNSDLRGRWRWHNEFYEEYLETAIPVLLEDDSISLSPVQLKAIIESYKTASLVDQATLVTSAAIKKHTDSWLASPGSRLQTNEEKTRLITPPKESFWAQNTIDHIKLILASRSHDEKFQKFKDYILNRYHAGDEKIFESRFKKQFSKYEDLNEQELLKIIQQLTIDSDHKILHGYLTIENPRLKAITDTLTFDNLTEYEILNSLIGISGFVLRKKILEYLDKTKIITNQGNIYEFPDEQVLDGLKKLLSYRIQLLRKPLSPYTQTEDTCGAVSLMTILNALLNSPLTLEEEMSIHSKAKSQYLSGDHFAGLADQASGAGLETRLIHSERGMFRNEGFFSPSDFDRLMEEYGDFVNRAKTKGAQIENGIKIEKDYLLKLLQDNYYVICAGMLGQNFLHSMVLHGYNQEGFITFDPLKGKSSVLSPEYIENFMNTSIGSWLLAIRKNMNSIHHLSLQQERFRAQANGYLNLTK